ncbi:MAG: type II toxin-antitoxin system RelE family toxin [Candidatus Parvarchaeum sp.]
MNFQKRQELESILSNGYTPLRLNDESASEIYRMYRKDRNYFNRVKKAIERICCYPEQAEKLTGRLKGYCSKHVGSKVIIYKHENEGVYITKLDEHDLAYKI